MNVYFTTLRKIIIKVAFFLKNNNSTKFFYLIYEEKCHFKKLIVRYKGFIVLL